MQKKLTKGPLLTEDGQLAEAGYSTSLVKDYSRAAVRMGRMRIKEWDYYLIYNNRFGVALTVADNSYMGLLSISFLDFEKGTEHTVSPVLPFTMGRLNLSESSERGSVHVKKGRSRFSFVKTDRERILTASMEKFDAGLPIRMKIVLTEEPRDSMVIATPFAEKKTAFYYNQKIIGMKAKGIVEYKGRKYYFRPDESFGLLDWGRGAWTYDNTWYWGALQGKIGSEVFGLNLGYGFGDTSAATENMLFLGGTAHKLADVHFEIPGEKEGEIRYLDRWKVADDEGRLALDFTPVLDRSALTSLGVLMSDQHQVFGWFDGTAVLDDGTEIPIRKMLGFMEKVRNKW